VKRIYITMALVAVTLTACGHYNKYNKLPSNELINTLRNMDTKKLCYTLDWAYRANDTNNRFYREGVKEAESRGLGDCSWSHKECAKIGLRYKSKQYFDCRIQMEAAPFFPSPYGAY